MYSLKEPNQYIPYKSQIENAIILKKYSKRY